MTSGAQHHNMLNALIVDDDVAFAHELAEGLGLLGISCSCAFNAIQALEVDERNPTLNVAAIDIGLPDIDGLELARKLLLRKRKKPISILFMTGGATLDRAVSALRVDAADFLQKPVDAYEVANAMRKASTVEKISRVAVHATMQRDMYGERISSIIDSRKARKKIFGDNLFADPVWDMLLELAKVDLRGEEVPVTSLCLVAGVSVTTALRRLDDMDAAGLIERRRDPEDGRRVLVCLTDRARDKIYSYLGIIGLVDQHTRC